ncbi:MAG: PorP/SprF family type IX secretion system membrane protein [Chitinophagales bacterium]
MKKEQLKRPAFARITEVASRAPFTLFQNTRDQADIHHSSFTIHHSSCFRIHRMSGILTSLFTRNFISITFIILHFSFFISTTLLAQDPHFSQFYEAPLLLNPARAGFINGTYELSGIYRSQWKDITIPFKTISGTGNINIPAGKNKNNILGIALTDFADKSGDGAYATNHLDACFAYHKNFGSGFNHYLGGGFMMGIATTSFDQSKLTFDEDFMSGTNTEIIENSNASFLDLAAGMEYNFLSDEKHFNAGFACYHLTRPAVSYSNTVSSVIYRKFVLNAGYSEKLTGTIDFIPRAAFITQGPSNELDLGADFKFSLTRNAATNYALYAGAYYRSGDAFIPKLRIDMGDLSLGFSYDITVSKLAEASQTAGGPEITILYIGRIKGISAGRIYNPRF